MPRLSIGPRAGTPPPHCGKPPVARAHLPWLLAALLCGSSSSAVAVHITETQALRLLRESPYQRELLARIDLERARGERASLYPNPNVSASLEGAGRTDFYLVEQTIAVNGRRTLLREAAKHSVSAEEAHAEHALRGIEVELREAFHRLVYMQRRESLIRDSIEELVEVVRILRERELAGEGSKFDRLRAERELMERRTERATTETTIAALRAELSGFLGQSVNAEDLVADGSLDPNYDLPELSEAISAALGARSDYHLEGERIEELRFRAAAANRLRVPNPVIAGGLKQAETFDGPAAGPVLSVSVDLPLFDKGQVERRLAEAEEARVRARREALERRIVAEVRAAHASLRMQRRIAEDYKAGSSSQAEEIRSIAETAYREGELGVLELLDSYRLTQEASLKLLELRARAKLAEVEYDRAVARDLVP